MALKILKVVFISLYSWSRETTAGMILRQGGNERHGDFTSVDDRLVLSEDSSFTDQTREL